MCFVAVEKSDAVEVFVGPIGDVGFLFVDFVFAVDVGALTAREKPAGEDRIFDEIGVLRGGGLVMGEGVVDECEEVGGDFAGDEETLRGSAVGERV